MADGGSITFSASTTNGDAAELYFRFEKNPYPDVDPSYETDQVTVSWK